MAKIRVHELAKELNIPSKDMVVTLQKMGLDIKNHMSTMEDSQAGWVRKKLTEPDAATKQIVNADQRRPEPQPKTDSKPSTIDNSTPEMRSNKDQTVRPDAPKRQPPINFVSTQPGRSEQTSNPNAGRETQREQGYRPRPQTSSERQTAPGTRPQTPSERQTTPGARPQTPSERQTTPGARPQTPSERQTTPGARPQTPSERQTTPGARPQTPSERQTTPGARPQTSSERQTTPGARQQTPSERQSAPGTRSQSEPERQPGPGIKPMGSSERQSANVSRPENRPRPQNAPPRSNDNRPQQAGGQPVRRPEGQAQNRNNGIRPDTGNRPAPRPGVGQNQTPNQNRPPQANRPPQQNRPAQPGKPGGAGGQNRPAGANKNFTQNKGPAVKRDYSRPQRKGKHKHKKEDTIMQTPELIKIGAAIQVRDLAEALAKTPAEIVKKLMELGTMATINQEIDYDTAEIVASLFGVAVEAEISEEKKILEEIVDSEETLVSRSPVVTVMGHVDHGKTSLLDKIRKADVVSGEAGGITQHIGAYQVTVNGNRITFIDTPGHAAFTAMRARGANLTDIVILVVAADDGVMPQTIEAINHIKAANVPFVVALNKIDKPDVNPDKVMQQLTEYNIVAEEWGGDTMFIPVSAKTGFGIEDLLERVLLIAELHDLRANPDRYAEGVVVEGELDKGKGAVATVLVQKGTLHIGDYIVCGVNWCKVRAMTDYRGRKVEAAYPSMPVEITGWSDVPEAGEKVQACDEKVAKDLANLRLDEKKIEEQKHSSRISLDDFFKQMQDATVKELNLIIKGDVQGSVEALASSLLHLSTAEVKVNVIHSAVGAISETDVMLASASNAIIIGFNVRPDVKARKHAEDDDIDVHLYRVIYEAIDDVKKAMEGLLDPEYKEKYLGRAEVRATFKVPNVGIIAGSYVIDGKIQRNTLMRVLREGVIIYDGKLESLKRFKDDVKEVVSNYECGIGIHDFNDVREGDIIEAFVMEEIKRTLE